MKRKLIYLLSALCLVIFSGCDIANISKNSETEVNRDEKTEVNREEKAEMTEEQEAVFRSYGLSEEEIAEMKEEGMNYKQQSFVDTAIIMLNYLKGKYGETFEVVGGDIPGILSRDYWITARACKGEYAGEKFDVYYNEEQGCTDGYIIILKKDEAEKALTSLIHEKFSDIYVVANILGEYGDEITLDMTGEQLLHIVEYEYSLIFTAPEMSEEVFQQRVEAIEKYLNDNDVFSAGSVFCFYNDIDPDMSDHEVMNLIDSGYETKDVYKWSEYIASR